MFEAVLPMNGNGNKRVVDVSQLLAVRVRSFGGVLRTLAPGASLRNGSLSLLAFKTQSRLSYMNFLLAVIAGRHTFTRELSSGHALDRMPSAEWFAAMRSSSKRMEKSWALCRYGLRLCRTLSLC